MPKVKSSKISFYAVAIGREIGIFSTWDECEAQVKGFPGAKYKKFNSATEAESFVGGTVGQSSATRVPSPLSAGRTLKPYSRVAPVLSEAASGSTSKPVNRHRQSKSPLILNTIADETGWDVVYSDGACKGNGQDGSVAGIGVWWGAGDPRNIAERCPGVQTNNRAELIAIVRVLETTPRTKRPLLVKTDSQYCISCFGSWITKWHANNFKAASGQPVKNASLICYLDALLEERGRAGQKVHLQYVKGHSGEEGNEGADQLANVGATMPEAQERDWEALKRALSPSVVGQIITLP